MSSTTISAPLAVNAGLDLLQDEKAGAEKESTLKLPVWFWALAGALAIWGFFTFNPLLTPVAILILAAITQLLWRPGEPPVLVFACAVQWLQGSLAIFYANCHGVSLALLFGSIEVELATWLSLIGVLTLAVGMRFGLLRAHQGSAPRATAINFRTAFLAYLAAFASLSTLQSVAFVVPGFAQAILAITNLKWAVLFVLFYCVIEQRRGYLLLVVALCLELVVGFLGYFAGFKNVFFLLLVVLLTSRDALKGKRAITALAVTISVLLLGIVWTAIKKDYRGFLNQDSGMQQVSVSVEERADKLVSVGTNFSREQFNEGFEEMLARISYVDYFARTIANVPDNVPYEDGTLWLGAIKHVVTPRILFPDKPALDDSGLTVKYTGIRTAGTEEGTSIGIGYMAESYVDFGPRYMFIPIFLLGVLYGLIYRYFITGQQFRLLGFAFGTALLLSAVQDFATSNVKIVGGVVTALIVTAIVLKILKKTLPQLA